ncbi:MAG: TPM domain-containing protein [Treponema sp.]|jgi:uncharacterized protein|nr:TPM domain-containing protein [Treponema sp.]
MRPSKNTRRIFYTWGIGQKDQDNGMLLILAMNERKVKIERDYGLESIVPNSVAGGILDNNRVVRKPQFPNKFL